MGPMGPMGPMGQMGPMGLMGLMGQMGLMGLMGLMGPMGSICLIRPIGPISPITIMREACGCKSTPGEHLSAWSYEFSDKGPGEMNADLIYKPSIAVLATERFF